jgi:hypothetical protein
VINPLLSEAATSNTEITKPETEERCGHDQRPMRFRQANFGVNFGSRDYRQDNSYDP